MLDSEKIIGAGDLKSAIVGTKLKLGVLVPIMHHWPGGGKLWHCIESSMPKNRDRLYF